MQAMNQLMQAGLAAITLASAASAQEAPPGAFSESRQLPGLSAPGEIIIDRAGVRARRTSLTVAHELGEVIVDEPGQPEE